MSAEKIVDEKLEDAGSDLNYTRKQFVGLMEKVERGEVSEIVVALSYKKI